MTTRLTTIVTGGSHGIGEGIVSHCLARGDMVINIDISPSQREEDARYKCITADLSDEKATRAAAAKIAKDFQVDCIVNNAGTPTPGNGARYFAGAGSLSASIGYRITPNISVHLDGNNLNNAIRYTYHITEQAPAAFYENGRQYFATVRVKF